MGCSVCIREYRDDEERTVAGSEKPVAAKIVTTWQDTQSGMCTGCVRVIG